MKRIKIVLTVANDIELLELFTALNKSPAKNVEWELMGGKALADNGAKPPSTRKRSPKFGTRDEFTGVFRKHCKPMVVYSVEDLLKILHTKGGVTRNPRNRKRVQNYLVHVRQQGEWESTSRGRYKMLSFREKDDRKIDEEIAVSKKTPKKKRKPVTLKIGVTS